MSESFSAGVGSMGDATMIMVRVIPRAGRTAVAGRRGGALLVRLAAAPVDGAANDALIAFMAERLKCPRRNISIVSGEKSRDKRLSVTGFTRIELDRRISELASEDGHSSHNP